MGEKIITLDNLQTFKEKVDATYASASSLAGKQDTLVSGTNIKTINSNSLLGSGNLDLSPLIETTWSALKALRDGGTLVPGTQYRITDYQCTTTQSDTSSAGHQFDLIVVADSTNKLNEQARAILHSGDTYFANSKLEAWQILYCLDNDVTRFMWADATNGKGVIYRMIDEFGNDVPYDFKNILFTVSNKFTNAYTFSYTEGGSIKDASILGLTKGCYSNTIKPYIKNTDDTGWLQLNFNVFYSTSEFFGCHSNTFSSNCSSNIFGNNCYSNTFGNNCNYNTFNGSCHFNTFGDDCKSNTFSSDCNYNRFGNKCSSNSFSVYYDYGIFGNNCNYNTFSGSHSGSDIFGDNCSYNTSGQYSGSNILGNDCRYITLGSSCDHNTFGSGCRYITFGTSSVVSDVINYCQYNTFDAGCSYLYIVSDDHLAGPYNQLQNVHVHHGVSGSSESNRKTITIPDRNLSYETNIVPAGTVYTEV